MRLKPDPKWIRERYDLLQSIRGEVKKRLGDEPHEVKRYLAVYERELRRRWRVSSKAELLTQIEASEIVYGGDFHAFGQAQRTHLKILRSLAVARPVVLGLECFNKKYQKWLDLFSEGSISIDELRRETKWDAEWGFPWEHYKPLFELAKRAGFRLLALNTRGGKSSRKKRQGKELQRRDQAAAQIIKRAHLRDPSALIYVIFGDLHLSQHHLPRAVREELSERSRLRDLIVHINSEHIYFQLAKKGLELTVDVVRLTRNQFCILSSPPWLQWQSYLLFLERTVDQDLETDDEDEGEDFDYTDQVGSLVRLVARDLGLQFKLDDLSVYSSDSSRIWKQIEQTLKPREKAIARQLLVSGRSFFLPSGVGYLSHATVNHAASLAGQYIHTRLSGLKRPLWRMPTDLRALIWFEAVAFFFSKLINHKRQSATLGDLRAQLAVTGPQDQGREAMRLALDYSLSELIFIQQGRRRSLQVKPRRNTSYLEAARILGGMMGERLYLAHRSRKLSKNALVQLLRLDVTDRNFRRNYEDILLRINGTAGSALGLGAFDGLKSKRERL